ncbi:hypothetical protein LUW77_02995 [Streptomyces radiopugnans]|nr:hypothetical protein LUW77_02995 [Streptomyces radiopugnans]
MATRAAQRGEGGEVAGGRVPPRARPVRGEDGDAEDTADQECGDHGGEGGDGGGRRTGGPQPSRRDPRLGAGSRRSP